MCWNQRLSAFISGRDEKKLQKNNFWWCKSPEILQ